MLCERFMRFTVLVGLQRLMMLGPHSALAGPALALASLNRLVL